MGPIGTLHGLRSSADAHGPLLTPPSSQPFSVREKGCAGPNLYRRSSREMGKLRSGPIFSIARGLHVCVSVTASVNSIEIYYLPPFIYATPVLQCHPERSEGSAVSSIASVRNSRYFV